MVGNFMFCKAIKNDCRKLYFKMDKLFKKECFKRFERVFERILTTQTLFQICKDKKIQDFKITRIQNYNLIEFKFFTVLVKFFAVLFVSHRTSSLVHISTAR